MSLCFLGLNNSVKRCKVTLEISELHPLIKLANTIDWRRLSEIVLPDLKKSTSKWKWWLGRKLSLRTHLGVYLLQQLTNATDRGIERHIRDNAVYQGVATLMALRFRISQWRFAICSSSTEPFVLDNLKFWDQRMVMNFVNKAQLLISALYEKSFYNVFHRDAVDCFNKLKHHKAHEMGRQFQIGRIGGNFVWSTPNFSLPMHHTESLQPMERAHLNTFQTPILSAVTDKGYYSKANEKFLLDLKIEDVALQRPNRNFANAPPNPITPERLKALANRRSGIEAIISHRKRRWQMGRSRMKLDRSIESSGSCAMLGFNLAQMMRCLST